MADSAMPGAGSVHASSWIDRLTEWTEGLPGPTWVVYALILSVGVLLSNAVFWIDGSLAFGSFDLGTSLFAFYGIWWLALYHYLTGHASQALKNFRPLLEAADSAVQEIDVQLRVLPRNWGWLGLLLGIVFGVAEFPGDLASSIGPIADQAQTALPVVFFTAEGIFLIACFIAFVFRTIRQLRLVSQLQEQALNIDLFSLGPAHAFSGLTSRTGLGIVLLLVIISLPTPWETASTFTPSAIDVVLYIGIAILAIVVFAVPLEGMRARLIREKKQAVAEVEELYRTASSRLFGDIRRQNYDEMSHTKDALSALIAHRERLDKVSTWPWDPRTIRGFTSGLLLPVLLLVVSQIIDRLF